MDKNEVGFIVNIHDMLNKQYLCPKKFFDKGIVTFGVTCKNY